MPTFTDVGRAATPTVARAIPARSADAGVVVTASHNPAPDNGLKLRTPSGQAYPPTRQDVIEQRIGEGAFALADWQGHGDHERWDGALRHHRDALVDAGRRATGDTDPDATPLDGLSVVLNGDVPYDRDSLTALYDADAAVGSYRVENPSASGVLRVEDGRVLEVIEKPADPPSDLVNTGAYVFPAAALSWLDVDESDRGELELTDVLQRACETTDVRSIPFDRWLDVGRPWELLAANEWMLGETDREVDGDVSGDADLRGEVVVEPGATIEPGVVIEGPAYVSAGSHVGPNAYLRGATYLGSDTRVGHSVEVKNSVVMAGSKVPHLTYLGDSVIGTDANLGAGTTVANLRHDGALVELTVKGDRVSTGRRKFGIVCSDGVKTGINCTINAGVTLSADATVAPGETVLRDR